MQLPTSYWDLIQQKDKCGYVSITNALNQMLKRFHHDKKKYVIPNLFRNLEFGNGNKLICLCISKNLSIDTIGFVRYLIWE